jgi:signal transduction histidine kinase
MAGLGTLAAGLAHELNNPAAALVRSTDLLAEALSDWHRRCAELGHLSLSPHEMRLVAEQEAQLLQRAATSEGISHHGRLGLLEAELEERIEVLGIEESWSLAPILAEAGWDGRDIDAVAAELAPLHQEPFLRWVASGAVAFGLVNETRQAARAISDIVASVRSYSALDRGSVQTVDVRETLANSLLILKRQLGEGIELVQNIPPDLPRIEGHGGELSQVWTNLIQNGVDAMNGRGRLEIHARPTGGGVEVQIVDSGPGIVADVRPRIFDPFFTTKPLGKGTGLGLAISYGIVVNQHRGSIEVESRPGRTVFSVALPTRCEVERETSG